MGTSGAYNGAGGNAGKDVSEGLGAWLDSLPTTGAADDSPASDEPEPGGNPVHEVTQLPLKVVSGLLTLLRPRGTPGGGSGGASMGGGDVGRRGGGAHGGGRIRTGSGRSSHRLSEAGGRAAAGAYAYVTGDKATLQRLGLDYDSLRALNDPLEVTRRIVEAACGRRNGTIEEAEERYVAAAVADWVLSQSLGELLPELDEVARYAIATIITEVISSELGEALRTHPDAVAAVADDELREAADVLAAQATLSVTGPTEDELTAAIEHGVETLRAIYGSGA